MCAPRSLRDSPKSIGEADAIIALVVEAVGEIGAVFKGVSSTILSTKGVVIVSSVASSNGESSRKYHGVVCSVVFSNVSDVDLIESYTCSHPPCWNSDTPTCYASTQQADIGILRTLGFHLRLVTLDSATSSIWDISQSKFRRQLPTGKHVCGAQPPAGFLTKPVQYWKVHSSSSNPGLRFIPR